MMDDLDQLKSAFDRATPKPSAATKAAHLALAQQNFDRVKPAKVNWLERQRARLNIRTGGAVAGSLAVCLGAVLLVLPQTPDAPQMLPSPALVQSADGLFAESSMADAADIAEIAPLSRAITSPLTALAPLTDQLDALFTVPSVLSVQSPWSNETWLVFVSADPTDITGVTFDDSFTARSIDLSKEAGLHSRSSGSFSVFEITTSGIDKTSEPIGEVLFDGSDPQPIRLDGLSEASQLGQFAAAVVGFSLVPRGRVDFGNWGMADAIALAQAHLGADPDGQRAAILAQMRAMADQ